MSTRTTGLVLLLVSLLFGCRTPRSENPRITRSELIAHVNVLASDKMAGRAAGSAGFDSAAAYVAHQLKLAGVLPGSRDTLGEPSYFQPVPLLCLGEKGSAQLTLTTLFDTLRLSTGGGLLLVHPGSRLAPFTVAGLLMDAGHGIRGGPGKDELAMVDVPGKILLLDLSTPASWRNGLPDSLDKLYRNPTTRLRIRLENLKSAAVVLIPVHPERDRLWKFLSATRSLLPVVARDLTGFDDNPTPHPAVFLVNADSLSDLLSRRAAPDSETGLRRGGTIPGIEASVTVDAPAVPVSSANVLGLVPGSDPDLAGEVITATAHLDHLGAHGLLVYHGANDNASGVSALLEVAEALAAKPVKRSVLFLFPTGEEASFLGSSYWILHPTVPLERVIAEINLDEVGRTPVTPIGFAVFGTDDLKAAFTRATENMVGVTISWLSPNTGGFYFYRSDQVILYRAGIPSVFLTTGDFPEYHTPADTPDKIEGTVLLQSAKILSSFLREAGNAVSPITAPTTKPGGERRAEQGQKQSR